MIQTDLSSFSYKKGSLAPFCKRCGNENFYRNGKNKQGIQRYKCRACGFRFVWTSDLPRRNFFSSIMTFAVELYTSQRMCASLRGIPKILQKAFNVSVSHEAVRKWVLDASYVIKPSGFSTDTWHIDETYIKIKGKGHWLWIVRCRESGDVIAWHLSKSHLLKDAKILLRKAMENCKGIRPERIITDGLWQYPVAIYKIMGWNWKEHKKRHVIDSGIGKNFFIERLNKEIKRRVKWFGTFQALASAKAFFGLWFYHHNTQYLT
jgi:transposase-like protein/DNA-directed RNA polymerase subunit RPC12/RpoP